MRPRKTGSVFRPSYTDKRTGELRQSANWTIRFFHRGKQYQESSGSTRKSDAESLLRKRLADLEHGRPVMRDVQRVTFEDLVAYVASLTPTERHAVATS